MSAFNRLIRSVVLRLKIRPKWARLGVWFRRARDFRLRSISVGIGNRVQFSFLEAERQVQKHEFRQIYLCDCYRLGEVRASPATVVDVGGNVGLFSIVARQRFPDALIHCYEPNPALTEILNHNLFPLSVSVFSEAVSDHAGTVRLKLRKNSLETSVSDDPFGELPMISLDTAVERCGGRVDLLKLDCEGCEWSILENAVGLDAVKEITMEFHLWAKRGSTVEDLTSLLTRRGFQVVSIDKQPHQSWGMLHAKRA